MHAGAKDNLDRASGSSRRSAGRRVGIRLALAGLVAALAAGFWLTAPDDSLDSIRRGGVIRVGYAVEPPYAFLAPDGTVTGKSPEVARAIAARLGIPRVEWRLVEFGYLIDGLENRRYDVIAAGMFITPERALRVAFSRPTFSVRPALLVRRGNPHGLRSYENLLHAAHLRIAVLSGSVEERRLLVDGWPAERLVRVPDALSGRRLVSAGQVDGLMLSAPTVRWMALGPEAGEVEMAGPFTSTRDGRPAEPDQGAMAFRRQDRALRQAWDAQLESYLPSEEHQRLMGQFGFTAFELPDPPATAEATRP